MAQEFKLPELGENIASGDLVRVMVKPGDTVKEGQPVIELETDKAVIEVPSTVSGKVQEVKVQKGQKLKVGAIIFTYGDGAAAAPVQPAAPAKTEDKPKAEPKAEAPKQAAPSAAKPAASTGTKQTIEFKLPELGENIKQGQLVRIIAKQGASVSDGQPILELETDKAVIEVPATLTGTIKEVHVKEGDKIGVGQTIFTVETTEGNTQPPHPHTNTEGNTQPPTGGGASSNTEGNTQPPHPHSNTEGNPQPPTGGGGSSSATAARDFELSGQQLARLQFELALRSEGKTEREAHPPDVRDLGVRVSLTPLTPGRPTVAASPTVRRLAREIGVDIVQVKGTGPGGRISEGDVKLFAKQLIVRLQHEAATAKAAPKVVLPDFSKWGSIEKEQMRSIRRKTAERLTQAWTTIPHVTQHDRADITELEKLREKFAKQAEAAGGKLTVTAIALKVIAAAMKKFPKFNASIDIDREEIIYKKYVHIGVAVDTEAGLLVPVLRNVDQKNVYQIAAEMNELSKRARERKLKPEEMEGGTFTITNLGGIGGTSFTPIVNLPEVAILGLSRGRTEPVWVNDHFEPRTMLPLSLSYDHRIIDGADAARYLRWVADALEQPVLLLLQG
ncbi:Dihydrolipoamide acetyltransferase [Candidatus Koribacter versatilis Ellin345]|uniref:Dihydrolipoamide acetyltransferase component of pyruvate dehydrogenase complex n=1 Tax=Koribacter versatilis (strain Ellin345) TaxID=204669 RepID=Q1IMV8_KORVE|nr:dihydrolipoyllysine-residue acetyltransferase [Candidatus Koribacter versatilis]ABF41792.1 Dihydrolipoamide acetyltransferase [Candidatus Koribacter versatilis Ellin345]